MVEESDYENRGAFTVNNSTSLARVVVRQIIESGITDVVISPGSRNAPLSLAFFAAAEQKLITVHVRIDERSAAYLALGLARGSGAPVAVVTTSGTAAVNLHPAIVEAAYSGVPIVAVTADRPGAMRGSGANQTIDQRDLFGDDVVACLDLEGLDEAELRRQGRAEHHPIQVAGMVADQHGRELQACAQWVIDAARGARQTITLQGNADLPLSFVASTAAGWPARVSLGQAADTPCRVNPFSLL